MQREGWMEQSGLIQSLVLALAEVAYYSFKVHVMFVSLHITTM